MAEVLNNYLLKMDSNKMNVFIDYFIECVIVHEIHHAYMYYYETVEYDKCKKDEKYNLYCDRPLEIQADNFMKQYMCKYKENNGVKIAELLRIMRSIPNGEEKYNLIDDIIDNIHIV